MPAPKVILSAWTMGIFSMTLASETGSPNSIASISWMLGRFRSEGRSLVMAKAATARAREITPSMRKTCCQPKASDIKASGPAALRAPILPTASRMPESEANSFLRYQLARIFMVGM